MSKKIGIIGSGIVAQTLGAGFIKHGYEVMLGTRDTNKLTEWLSGAGKGASTGSFNDAGAFGNLLILAVKGTAAKSAVQLIDNQHIKGKTFIDATNPIADAAPVNGVLTKGATSIFDSQPTRFEDTDDKIGHETESGESTTIGSA